MKTPIPCLKMTPAKSFFALSLALSVSSVGFAQEQESAQRPFRVDVNVITLRFAVRNASGELVNGLGQDAFRILDDGIPQEIAFFQSPRDREGRTKRLWLAFLLDVSGSTFATRAEEIVAAQTFLDNVTDATQTGIFGFTDHLILFQNFTPARDAALRAFREARKHLGRTAIYDSLQSLLAQMAPLARPEDDKAIIVLSDGLDDAYTKTYATISLAKQQGVRIYTVLVPSAAQIYIAPVSGSSNEKTDAANLRGEKERAFSNLSRETGGMHFSGFEAILDFDDTLAQINQDLFGNLYTIGYYTDNASIPVQQRNIDVRTKDPGLQASIPFRKLPRQLDAKRALIAALFDNQSIEFLPTASGRGFNEIGAQMDILPAKSEGELVGLPFRIKINPYSFRGATSGGVNTQLGVIGRLIDEAGVETVRLREVFRVDLGAKDIRNGRAILYTNRLLAPAGSYQLQIALLELATWRLTSFQHSVRIAAP